MKIDYGQKFAITELRIILSFWCRTEIGLKIIGLIFVPIWIVQGVQTLSVKSNLLILPIQS